MYLTVVMDKLDSELNFIDKLDCDINYIYKFDCELTCNGI